MTHTTAVMYYRENKAGAYPIMITRLGEVNDEVAEKGYREGHYIYVMMGGQCKYADYDLRRFTKKFTAHEDDTLLRLFMELEGQGGVTLDALDGRVVQNGDW
jgi:hypothetical protein